MLLNDGATAMAACIAGLGIAQPMALGLDDALRDRIRKQIRDNTTPRHVPAKILQVADIPRTSSGKTAELAVRDAIHGRQVRNIDALANPQALAHFPRMED